MRTFFLSLILFFATISSANIIGSVVSLSGNVKIKNENSFKKSKVVLGMEIKEGDLITTSKRGSLVIKLIDGSNVVVDVASAIHFLATDSFQQKAGKIFYKITSRDAKNSLKIKTPFAIIGIKGTTFVINTTQEESVILKEGLIGIKSIKEEFELYRKKVQEEFSNYVSKQQLEFEKFKNAQNRYAVAESTKEFDLEAGNRVSFSGNRVNEDDWAKKDDEEFEYFMKLVESMR